MFDINVIPPEYDNIEEIKIYKLKWIYLKNKPQILNIYII